MNERIKQLRKALGLTQHEFGVKLGVAANTITNYETGNRTPMEQMVRSICREFNVDYIWLTTGEGEMFVTVDTGSMALIDKLMSGENEFAKKVFKSFAALDEQDWKNLEQFIDKLIEQQKK